MRSITEDLLERLKAVADERGVIERRLQKLQDHEGALKLLLAEEEYRAGAQLPLIPARPADGNGKKNSRDRSVLSKFVFSTLGDRSARPLASLADLGVSRGLDFGGKNPRRVLHFVLVGLKAHGFTEMVGPSVWRLTEKGLPAEPAKGSDGNGSDETNKIAP